MSEHHETRSELTFVDRHIGPDAAAVDTLLSTIGVSSLDELAAKALPAGILDALTADGVAPAWRICPLRPVKPRRWPSCARWPMPTPSRSR